jgi:DNA (cytosine-5)-methyltransferase 1
MASTVENKPTAIDLFAGAGGATLGLGEAGFNVVAAIENDASAIASYRANHPRVHLVGRDIRQADPALLRRKLHLRRGQLGLLKACPPCQGHSSLNRRSLDDPRNELIVNVWLFVKEFLPKVILLENVPRLQSDPRLALFLSHLGDAGYETKTAIMDARDFGVPQRRKRLILMAARGNKRRRLPDDFADALGSDFLRYSPTLKGIFKYADTKSAQRDPLQKIVERSSLVKARIKAIPRDGNRFDLPAGLKLRCHDGLNGATSAYGRISLKIGFAPTMTTRCTSPSCGAFLHPTKDRAITLREASLIQTFPNSYRFLGNYSEIERQIGNAVPVRMARGLGLIALSLF